MHAMSALLDSLLGADRNELPNSAHAKKRSFADSDICKYYLVDFCPYDLFPNTRSHLGVCTKIHDDAMKEAYQNSPDKEKYAPEFEEEMLAFLQQLIHQAEQKIEKANRRIDAPLPENALLSEEQQKLIDSMNEKITTLLADAEVAGEKGDVEEAANIIRQVQTLRREVEKAGSVVYGTYMQREKSLRVCTICGAMQSVGDSMSRFESHVTGKQHLGYEKIRSCVAELLRKRAEREEVINVEDESRRSARRTSFERPRYEEDRRRHERRYEPYRRDRERRDFRDRDRERPRERDRDDRSRDRDSDRRRDYEPRPSSRWHGQEEGEAEEGECDRR